MRNAKLEMKNPPAAFGGCGGIFVCSNAKAGFAGKREEKDKEQRRKKKE